MTRPRGVWPSAVLGFVGCFAAVLGCQFLGGARDLAGPRNYCVAVTGSDASPGSETRPWRTIQFGADALRPGDTLRVRGGVYQETVNVTCSGTAGEPIHITAYPGETPIIDGDQDRLPSGIWGALLAVRGDYIHLAGFELCYSNGMGVIVSGRHCTVSGFNSHHNKENGILVTGDDGIVEDSRVWQNCYSNVEGSRSRGGWASGLSAARHPNDVILRRNTVSMNWGEGLSTYEANGTVLEDNVVYDNDTNIYVSDATNVTVQRNLVYRSVDSAMNTSEGSHVGIMLGDEKYSPPSAHIVIVNNLVCGNRGNLYWWQGTRGGGLIQALIANNTLVNAYGRPGIQISAGSHRDVRILNNIVVQDNEQAVALIGATGGIRLGPNLWSKSPPENALSEDDLVGDPRLALVHPGRADGFRLGPASPAVGRALPLPEVTVDYFGTRRHAAPDMGACESGDRVGPTPSSTKSKEGRSL